MTFIEKTEEFTPIRPAFRDRQYGSEFNRWELCLLKEFSYAKKSTNPCISGTIVYDGKLGRNRFVLIPAAHLPQDYVICECPSDIPLPANLTTVTIEGQKLIFHDYWEIFVNKIIYEKPKTQIKPDIDFKEFQQHLFLQWGGIMSPLKELLSFEFVSSPPMFNFAQAGGLNITLYDGTNRKLARKLLNYFIAYMPTDMTLGKSGHLSIPELATEQPLSPFSWRFRNFDADQPLNQHLSTFLEKRRPKKFLEVSIGLGSRKSQPSSIYDPPFRMVDQPTILPDNAEMINRRFDPSLEVTKYIITMKMLFPTIGKTQSDIEVALDKTSQKLVEMAEKYDLPSEVQQHGLFDPNYYGKPQSILRLALASARSQESTSIDDKEVLKVFETFYLKNLNNITEAWEDLFNRKGVEVASLNEYDRTILKFIVEKESNEFGVSFDALADKFILQPYQEVELRLSIQRLLKACKIREARTEIYRGIPFAK